MEKEQLKDKYSRFKQWQEQPYEYKLASDEVHHCNNCHHDCTGNYCPICSQKAGQGRIGWRSVHQGIMDIWGLGTRSLLYSVWQLLWRPGHIIGDYIDGGQQGYGPNGYNGQQGYGGSQNYGGQGSDNNYGSRGW